MNFDKIFRENREKSRIDLLEYKKRTPEHKCPEHIKDNVVITSIDTLFDNAFFPTKRVHLKKGIKKYNRDYIQRVSAVSAVVYDTVKKKYLFVKQFRPGTKGEVIELVAGMLDNHKLSSIETIKKEILEETGYKTDYVKFLTKAYTAPGYTDEIINYFYAEVSEKSEEGGGCSEENEFIETVEMSEEEVKNFDFQDGKCLLCFGLLGIKNIGRWN